MSELVTPDEESKGNEGSYSDSTKLCGLILLLCMYTGEADLVLHHLKLLLRAGVSLSDMAVIAPYNLQVGR